MVHCRERGDEMILGDLAHLHVYEQGGSAQVWSQPVVSFSVHLWGAGSFKTADCVCDRVFGFRLGNPLFSHILIYLII